MRARLGLARMVAFAIAWAMLELVVGTHLQLHYDILEIVWFRYAVHLCCLLLLFGWRDPGRLWCTSRPALQVSRSLLMLVMPASFALALRAGMTADATWAVFWTAPVLVLAMGALLLGEHPPAWAWVTVAAGTVAAFLAHPFAMPGRPWFLLFPLAMAASFSLYVVMTRSLRDQPVLTNLFYTALGVFLALTPLMPLVWITPSHHDLPFLAGIGAVGLLGLYLLDGATAAMPVSLTSPVMFAHVVAVVSLSALLGYGLSRRAATGAGLAAVLVVLAWRRAIRGASGITMRGGNPQ